MPVQTRAQARAAALLQPPAPAAPHVPPAPGPPPAIQPQPQPAAPVAPVVHQGNHWQGNLLTSMINHTDLFHMLLHGTTDTDINSLRRVNHNTNSAIMNRDIRNHFKVCDENPARIDPTGIVTNAAALGIQTCNRVVHVRWCGGGGHAHQSRHAPGTYFGTCLRCRMNADLVERGPEDQVIATHFHDRDNFLCLECENEAVNNNPRPFNGCTCALDFRGTVLGNNPNHPGNFRGPVRCFDCRNHIFGELDALAQETPDFLENHRKFRRRNLLCWRRLKRPKTSDRSCPCGKRSREQHYHINTVHGIQLLAPAKFCAACDGRIVL